MQIDKACHLSLRRNCLQLRIILNHLIDMAIGFPGRVVGQHIQDIPFFNGLFHGIDIKGFLFPFGI